MSQRSIIFFVCVLTVGIVAVALYQEYLGRWLPYLLIAVCPLLHLFMHKGHSSHTEHREGGEDTHNGKDIPH
ncbi:MAG TPA: DUF2933 domain-containing protein [Patescibacteria group bacterium]|nr:DUF2933 domain-containing protein [Patescibacteria group bacterium]